MNTIELNGINDNDSLYVCEKRKLDSFFKNGFYLTDFSSKEFITSSVYDLLYSLDQQIKTISFDIGMDKFLLKKGGFKAGEYLEIVEEYRSLHRANSVFDSSILSESYSYLTSCLKSCVLLKIDMSFDEKFNIEMKAVSYRTECKSLAESLINKNNSMFVEPNNFELVLEKTKDTALAIIVKIYEKFKTENPDIGFTYLDKFINYVNEHEFGFSRKM